MHSHCASCGTIYITTATNAVSRLDSLAIASVYMRRLVAEAERERRTHDAHALEQPPTLGGTTDTATTSTTPSQSLLFWAQSVLALPCAALPLLLLRLVVKNCILVVDIISIEHIRMTHTRRTDFF